MATITLMDHQKEAIAAIEHQFNSGKMRTLAVLATGSGKTIIYLHLVNEWMKDGSRVLILAHRRELIHQPLARAAQFYPELSAEMGVVMADEDDPNAQVVVATVQTASRCKDRLEAMGEFDYVVLDEAHHGTAATYRKLVAYYPNARWLGLTATPFRTDGDSLAKVFDSVAYRFPITAAIDRGVLVPFDAYGFLLPLSVEGVEETVDGWNEEALGDLLSAENAIEVVYEKWLEYCKDRQTICFTASVSQAYATASYFKSRGIAAEEVDGATPKKQRDDILKRFMAGKVQVVCNCQVWTEGVDVPEASAALMVCPTKSDLAYVQKLGRVLRTYKGKKDAIVLDFAPMEDRNIVMAGDILGVPRLVEKAAAKAKKAGLMVGASRVDDHGLAASVDPAVVVIEALKYLRKGVLAWSLVGYTAVATLSDTMMLAVELPNVVRIAKAEALRSQNGGLPPAHERLYQSLLQHRLWLCQKVVNAWNAKLIGGFETMDKTIVVGEELAGASYQPALAKKRRQWRNRPVSGAQIDYMRRLGITRPEGCTSGQAAQLISHELACRAIERVRPSTESRIMQGKEGI